MATERKPKRLIPQSRPRLWNTTEAISVHACSASLEGVPTIAGKKRESCGKYTAHEHVSRESTRGKHQVCVDEIVDGALEDGEEAKTDTGRADTETEQHGLVTVSLEGG